MKVNSSKVKEELSELITKAEYSGERIVIEKKGKAIAAIISYSDLERLEAMEDAIDSANLRAAVAESEGKPSVSPEELIMELGLTFEDFSNQQES